MAPRGRGPRPLSDRRHAAGPTPGLQGPFVFDDHPNIVANQLVAVDALDGESLRDAAFSLGNGSYPDRGLARLSFALNYYFAGERFDRFAFKLTNLVIHVLNGLLVYWLSVLLLRRYAGGTRPPSTEAAEKPGISRKRAGTSTRKKLTR